MRPPIGVPPPNEIRRPGRGGAHLRLVTHKELEQRGQ